MQGLTGLKLWARGMAEAAFAFPEGPVIWSSFWQKTKCSYQVPFTTMRQVKSEATQHNPISFTTISHAFCLLKQ